MYQVQFPMNRLFFSWSVWLSPYFHYQSDFIRKPPRASKSSCDSAPCGWNVLRDQRLILTTALRGVDHLVKEIKKNRFAARFTRFKTNIENTSTNLSWNENLEVKLFVLLPSGLARNSNNLNFLSKTCVDLEVRIKKERIEHPLSIPYRLSS